VNRLDELAAALEGATEGPWHSGGWNVYVGERLTESHRPVAQTWGDSEHDATFIALLRNHAADLIAVARAAERALLLTYDPSKTDAQNDEFQRRAKALNDALRPLLAIQPSAEDEGQPAEGKAS
jgi:hypothetical protein